MLTVCSEGFVRSSLSKQPSCPRLSQSNNPPNWKVQIRRDRKRWDNWRENQEHAHHFLWYEGDCLQRIRPGKSSSQFRIQLWLFHCDSVKMCQRFSPNSGDKKTGCCISTTHRITLLFSSRNLFTKSKITVVRNHPTLLCFPEWGWNWKTTVLTQLRWSRQNRRQCLTPSQNKTSRIHLHHDRSSEDDAYARKGTTSRVMLASRPKVSFWPDDSPSPKNYGYV
jgi:hypothetical protein